jgi:hypothetical protein
VKTIAKMQLAEVHEFYWDKMSRRYVFQAVCDDGTPENQRFAKYTPSGRFEMVCNNPTVHERLQMGKVYYFEISEAS